MHSFLHIIFLHYLHIPAIPLHKSPISFFLLLFSFNFTHFSNLCNLRSARALNFMALDMDVDETVDDPKGVFTALRFMRDLFFGFLHGDLLLRR